MRAWLPGLVWCATFVVFLMQAVEGRVDHSNATLAGLAVCFAGAVLASVSSVRAAAGHAVT